MMNSTADTGLFIASFENLLSLIVFAVVIVIRLAAANKKKRVLTDEVPEPSPTQVDSPSIIEILEGIRKSTEIRKSAELRQKELTDHTEPPAFPEKTSHEIRFERNSETTFKNHKNQSKKKHKKDGNVASDFERPEEIAKTNIRKTKTPTPPPPTCEHAVAALQGLNVSDMKKAVVLSEVLGQPLALRDDKPVWTR